MPRTDTSPSNDQTTAVEQRPTATPATRVIEAVAERRECAPTDLEPLYRAVDPEALDRLCETAASRKGASGVAIAFEYEGVEVSVTVTPDGEVGVDLDE